jgi:hypothetical protein
VKTVDTSACNSELYSVEISDSAVLPAVQSGMYKVSINPVIQSETHL